MDSFPVPFSILSDRKQVQVGLRQDNLDGWGEVKFGVEI